MRRRQPVAAGRGHAVDLAPPHTRLGWIAVGLDEVFVACVVLLAAVAAAGLHEGRSPGDTLWLAALMLAAIAASLAAGVTALIAIARRGERSILDVVALGVGGFMLAFVVVAFVASP